MKYDRNEISFREYKYSSGCKDQYEIKGHIPKNKTFFSKQVSLLKAKELLCFINTSKRKKKLYASLNVNQYFWRLAKTNFSNKIINNRVTL